MEHERSVVHVSVCSTEPWQEQTKLLPALLQHNVFCRQIPLPRGARLRGKAGKKRKSEFPLQNRWKRLRCPPQPGQGDLAVHAWCLATIPCHRGTTCPVAGRPHGVNFTTSACSGHWVCSSSVHPLPVTPVAQRCCQIPRGQHAAVAAGVGKGWGDAGWQLSLVYPPAPTQCRMPSADTLHSL